MYQQIFTAFQTNTAITMRAKDVCHVLGIGAEPKNTEGVRAKLKRLANRRVLTEPEPGLFTLATRPSQPNRPPRGPDSAPE